MHERPPIIDYKSPPPPVPGKSPLMRWWYPPLIACLLSLCILVSYPDISSIPHALYKLQQLLLRGSLLWILLALALRTALHFRR